MIHQEIMEHTMKEMCDEISVLPPSIEKELQKIVAEIMNRSGLFYRVFTRIKSSASVQHKFEEHARQGRAYDKDKKMQDIVGARIALYFKDDLEVCQGIIRRSFEVVGMSVDIEDKTNFKPMRLNYVCRLPQDIRDYFSNDFFEKYFIDDTFELQIRTVFSEGWHEIEHDMRYKCKEDWEAEEELWRTMNGIFATLETCDWSILALFEQLTYRMYLASNWEGMLRNKFRIRTAAGSLSGRIKDLFNENKGVAKDFLKLDREAVIKEISLGKWMRLPKTMDNLVFVSNIVFVKNQAINEITPPIILEMSKK